MTIASRYFVRLKDQQGNQVAVFTDWIDLQFTKVVNDVGRFRLEFVDSGQSVLDLFKLDCQIEVYRSIPGLNIDWYLEFEGLHRKVTRKTHKNGLSTFTSEGMGYLDLLARTSILYKAGTIRADKNDAAETVMKEYVSENCTSEGDDTAVGRLNYDFDEGEFLYSAELPGFSVETDGGLGTVWTGSRPYEPLLTVLRDIAVSTNVDFNVVGIGPAQFQFRTYPDQLGTDRSVSCLGPGGVGPGGEMIYPVIFSVPRGVVSTIQYVDDRIGEANAVAVLGKGDGSTRTTLTRVDEDAIADSPWNRCEISRPATNYDEDYETYSLQVAGDEILGEMGRSEEFTFIPLQQPDQLYGVHYFIGDRVTARFKEIQRCKRITEVTIRVGSASPNETIQLTFADAPHNP